VDLVLAGRVVAGGAVLPDGVVAVRGDRIAWVGPTALWRGAAVPQRVGTTLLPGLVDVHCHGGAGEGFPDADAAGCRRAVALHRASGTTSLLASLVAAPEADLLRQLAVLGGLVADGDLDGVHLEGPFLAPARCGAQDPAALRPGDPALLARLLAAGSGAVASMTLAPETARAADLVALLRAAGAVPSFGHTEATASVVAGAVRAAGAGPLSATHLFNGMPPLGGRAPGPVAACLAAAARGELVAELVADGVHLAPETVAMAFDLVGPRQVALVTDAMAAAGMPDGDYTLGALPVSVTGGVARLAGPGPAEQRSLAGGTATLLDVVRSTVGVAGVALADAVTAATATPAALLGLADRGDLAAGLRADVLAVDDDLRPVGVLRAGRWVGPAAG
jgi:N-acetylglucosamine-6-phosphate deacetylase